MSVVALLGVHLPAFAGSITVLPYPEGTTEADGWALDDDANTVVGFAAVSRYFDPLPARWIGTNGSVLDGDLAVADADGNVERYPIVFGIAVGIASDGSVAAQVYAGEVGSYAGIWDESEEVWQTLPRPFPGANCTARGMNHQGDVVGSCFGHAVVWSGGEPTVLPRPNPQDWCVAFAINDFGQVTGGCYVGGAAGLGSPAVAVLWTDGEPQRLWGNPESFDFAYGRAVNNDGAVAGTQRGAALEWNPETKKPVELAPVGVANAINNLGDAAGYVGANGFPSMATVWKADGTVVSLGRLDGGTKSWVRAINDDGIATGFAEDADEHSHAVLFVP